MDWDEENGRGREGNSGRRGREIRRYGERDAGRDGRESRESREGETRGKGVMSEIEQGRGQRSGGVGRGGVGVREGRETYT